MDGIRKPAVAGSFYPGGAAALADMVSALLAGAALESFGIPGFRAWFQVR